jgi:hypothetical protein
MAQPGTGGTNAATSLTACRVPGSFIALDGTKESYAEPIAAIATVNQLIKDDQNYHQPAPGSGPMWGWSTQGQLYVPNRGWLKCLPGDVVMVDAVSGWPILVSARAIAVGSSVWTTTAT